MSEANSEIATYIENTLEDRLESGELCVGDPTVLNAIQDALSGKANGM